MVGIDLVDVRGRNRSEDQRARFWARIVSASESLTAAASCEVHWAAKEASFKAASNAGLLVGSSFRPRDFAFLVDSATSCSTSGLVTHTPTKTTFRLHVRNRGAFLVAVAVLKDWRGEVRVSVSRTEGCPRLNARRLARELTRTGLRAFGTVPRLSKARSISHDGRYAAAVVGWAR